MNDADKLDLPSLGPDGLDEMWDALDQGDHYDRAGNRISMRDWGRLRQFGGDYMIVKQETIGDYFVSTVWLGLDHGFGRGAPVIFETMVFHTGSSSDLDCERYCTEEEASEGHERIADKVRLFAQLVTGPDG